MRNVGDFDLMGRLSKKWKQREDKEINKDGK